MPAPSDSHRKHWPILLGQFPGKEHRVVRDVLNWCLCGPDSTRTGVMRLHVGSLADELGWPKQQVQEAIEILAARGALVWSPEQRTAYLAATLARSPAQNLSHWQALDRDLSAFQDCAAVRQAREDLGSRPDTVSRKVSETVRDIRDQDAGIRIQDPGSRIQDMPPAEAVPPPAAPAPAQPSQPVLQLANPDPKADKPQPTDLVALYNDLCPSLARCAGKPGSAAAKAAAAAWKREPDAEAWAVRFRRAEASPHCTGANDRGWKADLLWLLDAKNAEKVDAGRYDARRPRSAPPLPLTPIAPPPPTTKPPDPDADLDDPTSERAIAWAALRERWPLAMRWVNFRGGKFPTVQEARDKLAEIIAKEPEERAAADAKAAAARAKEAQEREWGLRP